jgi:hypothetical protein
MHKIGNWISAATDDSARSSSVVHWKLVWRRKSRSQPVREVARDGVTLAKPATFLPLGGRLT